MTTPVGDLLDDRLADGVLTRVLDLIRRVTAVELLPRFRTLAAADIIEKTPGELVTISDQAAERALTEGLMSILPGSVVIGEEACHADPLLLDQVRAEQVWVVDPLDGTHHYAAGESPWGVMVALLLDGTAEAGWIHLPLEDRTAWGHRGGGVFVDGVATRMAPAPALEHLRGAVLTRFLPPDLRATVEADPDLPRTSTHLCAARRYLDLLAGRDHYALYYRTQPWDHAAGCLLAQEFGAAVHRFDGAPYDPTDQRSGLLIASDEWTWRALHERLLPQVRLAVPPYSSVET